MNKLFRIMFMLLAIAFLFVDAQADSENFQWCDRFTYNSDHPMVKDQEKDKQILLNTPAGKQLKQRKKFYQDLYHKFVILYVKENDFKDSRVQKTISRLKSYANDLDTKGERNTVWNSIYYYAQGKDEVRLQGIGTTPIKISCNEFETQNINSAVLGIAYLSRYMESLSSTGLKPLQIYALAEAELTLNSYKSWIFEGLAQWPWEMKVNEMLIPEKFNEFAPDWQLTFLRPNLAIAINPNDYNDAQLDYALTLEPIGFIKYFDDDGVTDYKHWWGISAAVSVTSDNGTGYGLLARYDNYMVSAMVHDSQDQDWVIYFGVDLYKYLLGEDGRVQQYQKFKDKYISSH